MRAVRFDRYGDLDVLEVRDVEDPQPAPGRVVVRVRAAAINPGEDAIRSGAMAELYPSTFPSGEGSDLAGFVEAVGKGVGALRPGDAVLGWTDERASHAELVCVPAEQLIPKPDTLPFEQAGSMFVAPVTALACVERVAPQPGETVVVSGAAGGVGSLAVQLARRTGATVIGLAGPANHAWLQAHDVVAVAYGDTLRPGLAEAAPGGVDAWIDCFGGGYVELALELGVAPARINTIIDFAAVEQHGVGGVGGGAIATQGSLQQVTDLVAAGELDLEVAATYPLDQVREAYADLMQRHTRGKIVLLP